MSELLTEKERAVLRYASNGLTSGQTAAALGISTYTVEQHRKNIFAALNAANIAHAVAIGLRQGIII